MERGQRFNWDKIGTRTHTRAHTHTHTLCIVQRSQPIDLFFSLKSCDTPHLLRPAHQRANHACAGAAPRPRFDSHPWSYATRRPPSPSTPRQVPASPRRPVRKGRRKRKQVGCDLLLGNPQNDEGEAGKPPRAQTCSRLLCR